MYRSPRPPAVAAVTLSVGLLTATASLLLIGLPTRAADIEPLQVLRSPGVDGLEGAEEVVVSDDGAFIYVAAGDQDGVGIFTLDEGTGTIAPDSVAVVAEAMDIALSPDAMNQNLYVASLQDLGKVLYYDRNPVTGALSNERSITNSASVGMMNAWSVAVSHDGMHVYVVGLADDSIAAFSRDLATGDLTHAETFFDLTDAGMDNPFEVEISPDDTQVIVASQGDDTVVGLAFDRSALDPLSTPGDPIPVPVAGRGSSKTLAFSPDGSSVYFGVQTSASGSPAIASYDRDPMTNVLTASGLEDDPELSTVVSLAVSPNGQSLIAAADTSDSLLTYTRAANGAITFFEQIDHLTLIPGAGGLGVGLDGTTSVAITASGNHAVAVAKIGNDAINLFSLPEPSGALLSAAALGALGSLRRRRGRSGTLS